MKNLAALPLVLLLCRPACAAVLLAVREGAIDAAALARTEAAAAELLAAPSRASLPGMAAAFQAAGWRSGLAPQRREELIQRLKTAWKERLVLQESSSQPSASSSSAAGRAALLPPNATNSQFQTLNEALSQQGRDRLYDGARPSGRPNLVVAGNPAPRVQTRMSAAAPRRAFSPVPAPAQPARPKISWGRAGWEVVKGAGGLIRDTLTWKGLLVAASVLVIATVAPVAVYAFIGLGAVMGAWTIGRAVVHGRKAYKAGDAKGFYAASREFGRGALSLGLSLAGARHMPTNLKPHFPRAAGEWKALASSMDDEPVVVMSLLRGRGKKP